jgi:hypothetical protein
MQNDLFLTKEDAYLKSLHQQRGRLKDELKYVNQEIQDGINRRKSYEIGDRVFLTPNQGSKYWLIYKTRPQIGGLSPQGVVIEESLLVSVDLLREALDKERGDTK